MFPVIGLLAMGAILVGVRRRHDPLPFVLTAGFFVAAFLTLAVMFWPYVIPYSIIVADAAAPDASLQFIFYGTIVVLPVILADTVGAYWIFRGKLRNAETPPELAALTAAAHPADQSPMVNSGRSGMVGRLGGGMRVAR